jgi:putative spermidine/putrescine transport system permease protein
MTVTLTGADRAERPVQPTVDAASAEPGPAAGGARSGRSPRLHAAIGIVGTLPYFLFVGVFLVVPILVTVVTAFRGPQGGFTLDNFAQLGQRQYVMAFANSLALSLVTSVIGAIVGLVLAWALLNADRPAWLRQFATSLSAVASQLGGPPLAYAFIALMGVQGMLTVWLRDAFGFELNEVVPVGSFWGLVCVYLYFQIPLMAILAIPALQGVRKEWIDGGVSLGASRTRILFTVTLPILAPSLAGGFLLLFANAFSGYAAAYALGGSSASLVPILIGFFLAGNVVVDEGLASALITGMVAIMVVTMGLRWMLLARATRWSQA